MKRKICALLLSILFLLTEMYGIPSYAEDIVQKEMQTVQEELGIRAANELCTLRVFRPGLREGQVIGDFVYLDQESADENGVVAFNFLLDGASGVYPYIVCSESGIAKEGNLYYVSYEDMEKLQTQEAYFLVDEDFNMLKANSGDALELWGWDILENGGDITYSYNDFTLHDTSADKSLAIQRRFQKQTGSTLILEFRFRQTTLQDGMRWQLCNGDTVVTELSTKGGKLYADKRELVSYQAGTEYGVRIEWNLSLHTYRIFINGMDVGGVQTLVTDAVSADSLVFATGVEAIGDTMIKPVRLSRGYLVQEEWIPYTAGNLTSGRWDVDESGGTIHVERMNSVSPPDIYSVVLRDTSTTESVSLEQSFLPYEGDLTWNFRMYAKEKISDFHASLSDSLGIKVKDNQLSLTDSVGTDTMVCTIKENLWHTIQIKWYRSTGNAVVQIDGKEKGTFSLVSNEENAVDKLRFVTGTQALDEIWIDDICLSSCLPLPGNYVPRPQTQSKTADSPLVGIQTCDLWREGKHFGWDKINQDYRRKPYLGFYDDGSSEVKDWEIKFMAEHGIDFSFHCWFRPAGGAGSPIKTPRNGAAIHEGYFNAQYRDMLKFAIAWENGTGVTTNEKDFRENIVPFWMEYYFKDSGYLLVDNKPVIGIYNLNGLTASFGEENVHAQLEYLRQACRQEGFDGAYILGVSGSTEEQTLRQFAELGFDALYCYSWGTSGYSVQAQQNAMNKQKDLNILPVIATLAMGRDDTPWNRSSGGFLSPGEVQTLARWTREEFISDSSEESLGNRIVLLDNWNEYGEGHFFMPAELSGFNYLEAVGQVFGQPQHSDVRPTSEQMARLCRLYPQEREVAPMEIEEQLPVMNSVKKGWYFTDGAEGFQKGGQVTGWKAENGVLSGSSTGTDPIVYSPNNLEIDISNVTYLRIRMQNKTTDTRAKIYFITDGNPQYSEQQGYGWDASNHTEAFIDYLIPIYKNRYWTGTLEQLRIDPSMGEGEFSIDSIELLENIPVIGINQIVDSSVEQGILPQIQGGTCEQSGWEFNSGIRSLCCKVSDSAAELRYPLSLSSGRSYLISMYGKGGGQSSIAELWLHYRQDGLPQKMQIQEAVEMPSDVWTFCGERITLPSSGEITDAELVIKLFGTNTIGYFDDISVYELPAISVQSEGFYDENGHRVDTSKVFVGEVTHRMKVSNLTDKPLTIMACLAAYQADGVQQECSNKIFHPDGGQSLSLEIGVQANNSTMIKQFLWNETLTPLHEVIELRNAVK